MVCFFFFLFVAFSNQILKQSTELFELNFVFSFNSEQIVVIDLILHKPKAYRHLLYNVLVPQSSKFHVWLILFSSRVCLEGRKNGRRGWSGWILACHVVCFLRVIKSHCFENLCISIWANLLIFMEIVTFQL